MHVITSDTEIFELLERSGRAGFDPKKISVLDFVFEEHWHLLLFNPEGAKKGCRLFVVPCDQLFFEAEKELIPALLGLDDEFDKLVTHGLEIVEHLLQDKKNEQLYFDGH
jgi:hypothetical protein